MINHTLFCNQEGNSPSLTLTRTPWKNITGSASLVLHMCKHQRQVSRPYTLRSFSFYPRVRTCHKAQAHKNEPVKSWRVRIKLYVSPQTGGLPGKSFLLSIVLSFSGTKGFK